MISEAKSAGPSVGQSPVETIAAFEDVSKTYDGTSLAVANFNLQIARGEFITFLGPSGSGKTTSLMMLAGFEDPTGGDIKLGGRSVRRIPPHRRNIGMVFQNYALFPHMTVAENIAFPLSVRRFSKDEIKTKVARALDLVRLGGFGDRRPAALSGGQQQRVAFARALVFDPDLVLMDEPLGALDKQLREQLQLEIKHIHANLGVTVVYVTHDQSEALTLSNRIVIFKDGAVQQIAPPSQIYREPANSFVAQFIGENNRLDGRVTSMDGKFCAVETAAGTIRALLGQEANVGGATSLSIRPERISIVQGGAVFDNVVQGEMIETIYHGDHVRLRVRLRGGSEFTLKVPADAVPQSSAALRMGWQAIHCRALDLASTGEGGARSEKSDIPAKGVPA
jgi:putative spermidine/putrescine transport system ATP-binding protein